MRVLMLGINHRTADVALREKLALSGPRLDALLGRFRQAWPTVELVVLSTCNRTELYLARPTHEPPTMQALRGLWAEVCQLDAADLTAATIHRDNDQAVGHLFRVCAGLDSMVLGEAQILGQVKRAYDHANQQGLVGPVLHTVFQQASAVAKQVRTQTGIDQGRVSIASVAVDFAQQIFESFHDKTIVGIGAGEMAKLTLRHLQALDPARLWLVNRSVDRARELAMGLGMDARATVRPMDDLDHLLVQADVVLTSTGSPEPIITAQQFGRLTRQRRSRPLFVIDTALPRDVEPAVGACKNVYLYNIDDLQAVVAQTHEQRSDQVQQCEAMLREMVDLTISRIQHRDIGQLIKQLRTRLHTMGQAEQQRTLRKLAACDPDQMEQVLEEHTRRLINKVLHLPLSQLDRRDASAPLGFLAAALRRLFDLDDEPIDSTQQSKMADRSALDSQASAPAGGQGAGEPSGGGGGVKWSGTSLSQRTHQA